MLLERTTTSLLNGTLRSSIRQLQVDLQNAQTEMSTGRFADAGLALGSSVRRNLDWRTEIARLETTIKRNEILSDRASVSQAALGAIKDQSDYLLKSVVGARSAINGGALMKAAGEGALKGMLDAMSANYAGQYVFGGNNPDGAPLSAYEGEAPQTAFDDAFFAEFGFSKTDPQAINITPSQMQTFLQGRFDDLFKEPAWSDNWSDAGASNQLARIDGTTMVDADANANEDAFRQSLKAAVAAYELGGTAIGQATLQLVADTTASDLAEAAKGLGDIQARIGFSEEAIGQATARMTAKKSLLENSVTETEGVSQFDAATRINTLMTQLEASYSVTGRISKLSLLNYI